MALKLFKGENCDTEAANNEIKLLKLIRDKRPENPYRTKIVQLIDNFEITGIHGTHVCMVMEVVGSDVLKLMLKGSCIFLIKVT